MKTLGLNVLFALSCSPQGNVPELPHSAAPSNSANGDDGSEGTLCLCTNVQTVSSQQVTHRNAAKLQKKMENRYTQVKFLWLIENPI